MGQRAQGAKQFGNLQVCSVHSTDEGLTEGKCGGTMPGKAEWTARVREGARLAPAHVSRARLGRAVPTPWGIPRMESTLDKRSWHPLGVSVLGH